MSEITLTSLNVEELFGKNKTKYKNCHIVYAEDGDEWQEYMYKDGKRVKQGTPIGYEKGDKLFLLDDIYFLELF